MRRRNILHFTILMLRCTVNSRFIILLNFLWTYYWKRFLLIASPLSFLEMRLLLGNCLFPSVFVVQLIPLGDFFFVMLEQVPLFSARTLWTLIFRTVFLQLEFFLNIFKVVLIHVGEDIIRILTVSTY